MENFRTPTPGGGQLSKKQEIGSKEIQYETIINQQSKQLEIMEKMCAELKNEIALLKAQNHNLKTSNNNINLINENKNDEMYVTDEEELARETDWILKKRPSKKRKAELSPDVLEPSTSKSSMKTTSYQQGNYSRPPPIMVSGECEYQKIFSIAKNEAKKEFTVKLLNNNIFKINTADPDDYRNITKIFSNQKLSWYTYENKQSRPIKVMAKNLHHTNDPKAIISDLQEKGFKAINAVNKLKWKTKEPLDMFLLTFDATENIKKIYEIKSILHSIVVIEAVKQSKLIPQCKSCQSYGHTQNYCGKHPRCVKCAGKHKTIECQKPVQQQPKCCNCGEAHPANYRRCEVAKELQKIRDLRTTSKKSDRPFVKNLLDQAPNNLQKIPIKQIAERKFPTNIGPTYSQVVKESTGSEDTNILQQILEKLTKQNEFTIALEKRLLRLEKAIHQAK